LFFYTFSGLVVNGFVNVVITTIERRYGLRSSQTGLIASGYDIASFLFLVPVTYFGGRRGASKPRWIGWGVVIMGMGSFVFALPHFLVGQYRASGGDSNVCHIGNGTLQVILDFFFQSDKVLHFLPSIWSRTKIFFDSIYLIQIVTRLISPSSPS
jgi:MFS family permease